ncbi:MAG: DUF1592 domain-containing protein [Pirellulales bacterium]
MMRRQIGIWTLAAFLPFAAPACSALADVFAERIEPFAKKYCHSCHRADQAKGELDMTRFRQDRDVVGDFRKWNTIVEFIRDGEMPPDDSTQPSLAERNEAIAAIKSILLIEARKTAGDPGRVPPRRLSNTEFDLSVRDLTGVPIRATAEFPPDPAGGEGFDNTGEALGMTPSLLNKYLGAAQHVAEHLVLKPTGVAFAPFPVTSYNERKTLAEQAIIHFYQAHDVDLGAYVEAAWRYRGRTAAERSMSPADWATQHGLSARYLTLIYETLEQIPHDALFVGPIGADWKSLPAPAAANDAPPSELRALAGRIEFWRRVLGAKEPALIQSNAGNWPIAHLALRATAAAARDRFSPQVFKQRTLLCFPKLDQAKRVPGAGEPVAPAATLFVRIDAAAGAPASTGYLLVKRSVFSKADHLPRNEQETKAHEVVTLREALEKHAPAVAQKLAFGKHPRGGDLDADSFVVAAPGVLELPLDPSAALALQGKHLLVECELDATHSRESAIVIQAAKNAAPTDAYGAGAELLLFPDSQLARSVQATGEQFCRAFPNRFFYVDRERGLAAGFHLVEGFFRDDQPLVEKVLSDAQRMELDRLWRELDFVTQSVETMLRGFVWFERAERHVLHDKRFDFLRSEDPALVEEVMLARFEREYLEKLGVKLADADALTPARPQPQFDLIHGFFQQVRAGLAEHRRMLADAEQPALADVRRLAERAYCRPLRAEEAESLDGLYQRLRRQGQGVEDSLRGVLVAILMAPDFFYRLPDAASGDAVQPLSDLALARRLAALAWSSLPDDDLLAEVRAGRLRDEAVLRTHTRRMLRDPKVEAFAREFFGQWLRYRDYLAKDTLPAGVYPGYDAKLRQAMFEEPTRLASHVLQNDLPLDEFLFGDATFVNEPLAKLYGGTIERRYREQLAARGARSSSSTNDSPWLRVAGLRESGRGGLVSMPVVLAKNTVGQRTSPVKRGFWVVHHLLGQHFPPPPADVPELPKSEKEAEKTIRELLAAHTQVKQCAMCHVHFDGLGLVLEGFDVLGRARNQDLAGRPIQTVGVRPGTSLEAQPIQPDGSASLAGVAGLIQYLDEERREDLERHLCRKFLGYALGRSVLLSDEPLLEEMQKRFHAEPRFSVLFEMVVLSPQFRYQRGRDSAAP